MASEKPAHILEISDALGRDVDKAREGKIAPPPIEAFMSDAALAQVEAQTAAAAAPIHADALVPITKEEGARRTTFNGETLPNLPATRRVLPPPFQRPRFDLDRHGRRWTTCPVEAVKEGDMVVDVGRVACDPEEEVQHGTVAGVPGVATGMKVILTGISGNRLAYEPGSSVRAFRLAELWLRGRSAACARATAAWTKQSAKSSAGKSPGWRTPTRTSQPCWPSGTPAYLTSVTSARSFGPTSSLRKSSPLVFRARTFLSAVPETAFSGVTEAASGITLPKP